MSSEFEMGKTGGRSEHSVTADFAHFARLSPFSRIAPASPITHHVSRCTSCPSRLCAAVCGYIPLSCQKIDKMLTNQ